MIKPSDIDRNYLDELTEGGPWYTIEDAMSNPDDYAWIHLTYLYGAMLTGSAIVAAGGDALYRGDGNDYWRVEAFADTSHDGGNAKGLDVRISLGALTAEWLLAYHDTGINVA